MAASVDQRTYRLAFESDLEPHWEGTLGRLMDEFFALVSLCAEQMA